MEMKSPKRPKNVQSLIGKVTTLYWFNSRAVDRCLFFLKKLGKY